MPNSRPILLFKVVQAANSDVSNASADDNDIELKAVVKLVTTFFGRNHTMTIFIKNFCIEEDGAVTVDWVVLTAAVVGLGIVAVATVSTGVDALSTKISNAVSVTAVADTSVLGTVST